MGRSTVNWRLVTDIAVLTVLALVVTISFRMIGPVAGINVRWLWVLAPAWVGIPLMLAVAALSKWWAP